MSSVVAQQLQQLLVVAGRKQGELAEVFQGQGMGMCKGDAPLKWKFPSSRRTGHSSKPTTLPVFQMLVGSACWGGERGGGDVVCACSTAVGAPWCMLVGGATFPGRGTCGASSGFMQRFCADAGGMAALTLTDGRHSAAVHDWAAQNKQVLCG
jgi:hypothetical protein